jgi:hypothetical protein
MQFVADERNGSTNGAAIDKFIFSEQIGIEAHLPFESRFKLAYAYHDWKNFNINTSTGVAYFNGSTSAEKSQEGNRKIGSSLANRFGVQEISAELSTWIMRKPLSLQGTFLKNNRAGIPANSAASLKPSEKKDMGYQTGLIFGKAGTAKCWEVAYFYKYLAADATVADAADSDFGDGGTNRRGHIAWVAYSPLDHMTFQAKYFQTKNVDTSLSGANGSMDRVQLDMSVKF